MKKLITILAILFTTNIFCQNIVTGNVDIKTSFSLYVIQNENDTIIKKINQYRHYYVKVNNERSIKLVFVNKDIVKTMHIKPYQDSERFLINVSLVESGSAELVYNKDLEDYQLFVKEASKDVEKK